MVSVTDSIEIDRPVETVYNQWTQFETFPQFMEGIVSTRQLDDTHVHWVAEAAGRTKEWDAEIREQTPDRKIAWASISGLRNDGEVTFDRLDGDRTRLTMTMEVEPDSGVEKAIAGSGLLERRVNGDLERFRDFIEQRNDATGAWRGSVDGNG